MTRAQTLPVIPAPTPPLSSLRRAAADIKLAHSVFALPFALLAAFIARPSSGPAPRFAGQLALIVLCMVAARTWAMLVNRLADRSIDAANPRTARRAIPGGRLAPRDATAIALACAALFLVACSLFRVLFHNPWPLILAVPVLAWLAFYSYTKRFTALCHLVLGASLAASPLAAAIAVGPGTVGLSTPTPAHAGVPITPALFWIAGMVLLWVAGFDVIYAIQDIDPDRAAGLSSIPARLGHSGAAWAGRLMHAGAFACLVGAARSEPRFGPVFFAAVALVAALLIAEHAVLAVRGHAGIPMAFFTINGVVSCVLGVAGIADVLR